MDDLISRETMKDAIDSTTWYHQNRNKDMVEGASDEETAWFKTKDVFKAIENVPTAQRTGRWILKKVHDDGCGNVTYNCVCSECGTPAYEFGQSFCHKCGLQMEAQR